MITSSFKVIASGVLILFAAGTVTAMAQGRRGGANGQQIFATNCAGCHGGDGKGSDKAPGIATMQSVISLSNADLMKIVHDGTAAGMPPFAQLGDPGITAVVTYLRTLQGVGSDGKPIAIAPAVAVNGSVANGRSLFFGKAQCSSCHMIAGEGGVLGSDMTAYAVTHQPAAIQQSILNPGAAPAPTAGRRGGGGGFGGGAPAKAEEIQLKSGQKLTGMVRNEDNMGLTLLTQDGRFHFVDRSAIAKETQVKTLMPTNYGTTLTSTDVNDIVAFLVASGKSAPVEPAATPAAGGRRGGGGGGGI